MLQSQSPSSILYLKLYLIILQYLLSSRSIIGNKDKHNNLKRGHGNLQFWELTSLYACSINKLGTRFFGKTWILFTLSPYRVNHFLLLCFSGRPCFFWTHHPFEKGPCEHVHIWGGPLHPLRILKPMGSEKTQNYICSSISSVTWQNPWIWFVLPLARQQSGSHQLHLWFLSSVRWLACQVSVWQYVCPGTSKGSFLVVSGQKVTGFWRQVWSGL